MRHIEINPAEIPLAAILYLDNWNKSAIIDTLCIRKLDNGSAQQGVPCINKDIGESY